MVEFLECFVVVLWREKLPALDTKRLRDEKGLLRNPGVEGQDYVQLIGWEEVPESHLSAEGFDLRVIGHKALLNCRIHTPVHTADPLHEAYRVPVDVVIDHPAGILQVETFRQHVGGDEHADLAFPSFC